jgi:secretion/DNA translocation related CpaE-like protein
VKPAPVAVTSDPAVRARMERAAAAAQVSLDVTTAVTAPGGWQRAPVVLLDAATVPEVAAAGLPKRERIVVLAGQPMTSAQWQACVALGVDRVVAADDSDYDVVQLLTEATDDAQPEVPGSVIAVIGACGGVGASVFAAAVALAAAESERRTVLVDADPDGAGLEVLLGMESGRGAHWDDIAASHGRIPESALRQALPAIPGSRGAAVLLGFGQGSEPNADIPALDAVLDAARRGGDMAVVDLPRHRTARADRVVARADLTVIVAPAEVRGCYAASRLVPGLDGLGARLGLVVRGPSPGGVGAGDVAAAVGIPLIATMRPQPGLARAIDGGSGLGRRRGPLRAAARVVVETVGQQR